MMEFHLTKERKKKEQESKESKFHFRLVFLTFFKKQQKLLQHESK